MNLPSVLYSKEIDEIAEVIISKLEQNLDVSGLIDYIEEAPDLKLEKLQFFVRNILDTSLLITIKELKGQYGFDEKEFRNFPSLDELIYHDNGWTLNNSVKYHYDSYNRWRIKENLINALLNLIATEIQRLPHTTFDTLVRILQLYKYVQIYGEAACSDDALLGSENQVCAKHIGIYEIGIDDYELPPYHTAKMKIRKSDQKIVHVRGCKCEYVYYDDPKDIDEDELDHDDE